MTDPYHSFTQARIRLDLLPYPGGTVNRGLSHTDDALFDVLSFAYHNGAQHSLWLRGIFGCIGENNTSKALGQDINEKQ